MENLIQAYLTANNLTGINGFDYEFRVTENGEYYISKWAYEIPAPNFSQQEIEDENLNVLKKSKISECKRNTSNQIYAQYPLYKQISIQNEMVGYTADDISVMESFIEPLIYACRDKETQINNCTTIEELNLIE